MNESNWRDPHALADRNRYRVWTTDVVRFADTDSLGHVNNAVFATFFESGRVHFLLNELKDRLPSITTVVIARLLVDFRGEILWPNSVDIGTTVFALGRSSMTFGQGLFVGGACVATAESVLVLIDAKTHRPVPLPDDLRASLESMID